MIRRPLRSTLPLAFVLLIAGAVQAFAAPPPRPVPRAGEACPSGYYASGGFCAPSASARYAVPRHGACPSGYFASGTHCVAASQDAPLAVERGGKTCPSGFVTSGDYCVGTR